jgi:hypothetical protein
MAALVFLVLKAEAEYQAAPDAYSDARLECWVCVIQNRGRIFALASVIGVSFGIQEKRNQGFWRAPLNWGDFGPSYLRG